MHVQHVHLMCSQTNYTSFVVHTGPGKPGKSWNFFYGVFQGWKALEKGPWSWKGLEICLTWLKKNMNHMKGSKEN